MSNNQVGLSRYNGVEEQAMTDAEKNYDVAKDKRRVILKEVPSEDLPSHSHYINVLDRVRRDIRRLTYSGKPVIQQLYFRVCYALNLKDPTRELEKRIEDLEFMTQEDAILEEYKANLKSLVKIASAKVKITDLIVTKTVQFKKPAYDSMICALIDFFNT